LRNIADSRSAGVFNLWEAPNPFVSDTVVQQGELSVGVMHFAVEQPSKKE
jgi:hypothetical protein